MTDPSAENVYLSLIIPAYNEAERLGATLKSVVDYLSRQSYTAEVIVVDDGSEDETVAIARREGGGVCPVRVVSQGRNLGKGAAVRTGMLDEARGQYRVFYDADASTPVEELEKLWPQFLAGADVVIGSRSAAGSDILVRQVWYREQMGRLNNRILRALGVTRLKDTQCGFKGFTARACGVVFPRQTIERFSFDAELLYIAEKHGLRVAEVPVRWANSESSRVHPVWDSGRMVVDLLTIRVKDWLGRYR